VQYNKPIKELIINIQISILTANQVAHPTKTPGKTTPKLELAYKNLTFQGKVEGKALFSFGAQEGAYKALLGANHGDVFDIEVVKNGQGYNDWVAATKTTAGVVGTASPTYAPNAPNKGNSTYVASPKSSYPTDEERAKTQVYIVRQSNITAAINLLSVGAKSPPKLDDVINTAKKFEDHVFGVSSEPVADAKSAVNVQDLPEDDIPF
jgi:hypothetical protein